MKKKKWLSLILVATGLLTACGAEKTDDKADAKPTVGVLQLVAHASLDASYDGFLEDYVRLSKCTK